MSSGKVLTVDLIRIFEPGSYSTNSNDVMIALLLSVLHHVQRLHRGRFSVVERLDEVLHRVLVFERVPQRLVGDDVVPSLGPSVEREDARCLRWRRITTATVNTVSGITKAVTTKAKGSESTVWTIPCLAEAARSVHTTKTTRLAKKSTPSTLR